MKIRRKKSKWELKVKHLILLKVDTFKDEKKNGEHEVNQMKNTLIIDLYNFTW